jgi:ubiquinone/menaquinone biosynthesis C-methylase UbiE
MDALDKFKQNQREGWAHFAPLELLTTAPAAQLVRHAGVKGGDGVLDVACGTGVVAITAARLGARVTGLDLTPELLERARENAVIAKVPIDFHEGDVEQLPFDDNEFDVVLSQYGHMFAPRPEVAIAEMLRVLRPGGTLAFSKRPPEMICGRMLALAAKYAPPPPPGVAAPPQWGDPSIVRARLGEYVTDVRFDRATMIVPVLSPQHHRTTAEQVGPMRKLIEMLSSADPAKLEVFRCEYEAIVGDYLRDNMIQQHYLMTRATKA